MASTVVASGTLTADGTEQTVATPALAKVYVVEFDLALLAAAETARIKVYQKVLNGGTERIVFDSGAITGVQAAPDIIRRSVPIIAPQGIKVTFQQTGGTYRNYPYSVETIADVTVEGSGTLTTDGTEQTLSTLTTNKTFALLTDHNAQPAATTVTLRLKKRTLSGGTVRVIEQVTTASGALSDPDKIQQSVAIPCAHGITATLEETGTAHDIPWAVVSMG